MHFFDNIRRYMSGNRLLDQPKHKIHPPERNIFEKLSFEFPSWWTLIVIHMRLHSEEYAIYFTARGPHKSLFSSQITVFNFSSIFTVILKSKNSVLQSRSPNSLEYSYYRVVLHLIQIHHQATNLSIIPPKAAQQSFENSSLVPYSTWEFSDNDNPDVDTASVKHHWHCDSCKNSRWSITD